MHTSCTPRRYAGEDLGFAQRIYEELAWPTRGRKRLSVFYSETAWNIMRVAGAVETVGGTLREAFTSARAVVPVLSHHYITKPWPLLELGHMCERGDRLVPVSTDGTSIADIDVAAVDFTSVCSSDEVGVIEENLNRFLGGSSIEAVPFDHLADDKSLEKLRARVSELSTNSAAAG